MFIRVPITELLIFNAIYAMDIYILLLNEINI